MFKVKTGLIKWLGGLLVLLSLGFIAQQLSSLDLQKIPSEDWFLYTGIGIVGSIIYGILSFSQSLTWYQLLRWSGEKNSHSKICHGIYGRAQLAKYLPGNIFSIAGRHILGRQAGFKDSALAWAAVLEILGMLFISALLFFIGTIFLVDLTGFITLPIVLGAVILPFLLPLALKFAFQHIPKLKPFNLPPKTLSSYLQLYLLFFIYIPFFLAGAGILWCLIYASTEGLPPSFLAIVAISAGAWFVGYITPGASGGIGVRDSLLILALKPIVGDAIIISAVVFRFSTIVGDVVYFLLASLIPIKLEKPPSAVTTP